MTDFKAIIDSLNEYIDHYKELLEFEQNKLKLVSENKASELNSNLQKEQILIMKGNSLEAKRIKILKEQGFENKKLCEIIEAAPDEYKSQLQDLEKKLTFYIYEVKKVNERALDIVTLRLKEIDIRLSGNKTDMYDYHGLKAKHSQASSSLSRTI